MPAVFPTSQAHADLVEIAFHIAEQNPAAAERWLDHINANAKHLHACLKSAEKGLIYHPTSEV